MKLQYSVRALLMLTTLCAMMLAVSTSVGPFAGGLFVSFLVVYLIGTRFSRRTRIILATSALFISMLPWLGVSSGPLVYPVTNDPLPSLQWQDSNPALGFLWRCLNLIYLAGELPVHIVFEQIDDEGDFLFRPSGHLEAFGFFVLWFGVALMLGTSAAMGGAGTKKQQGL